MLHRKTCTSVTVAVALTAVMFWPTCICVVHIWSCLRTCAEVYWCWQASLTLCAYLSVFDHWNVRVCAPSPCCRRDITVRGLLWGHMPTHSLGSSSRQLEVSGSVSLTQRRREGQTWREVAKIWHRFLQGGKQQRQSTDTGMKGGRFEHWVWGAVV